MSTIIAGPLLNDIAIFVEVARARHFSRAAQALGMPVSTVSRRTVNWKKKWVWPCSNAARAM
ncbi:LysR family transcriptional regulator [Alcaligenes nematophilus]|uniref:helix-turn-helix domain-containing protein n=1 Tax=Alcaligenes nematophilus TaxID=2994643 RepID=UPI0034E0D39D